MESAEGSSARLAGYRRPPPVYPNRLNLSNIASDHRCLRKRSARAVDTPVVPWSLILPPSLSSRVTRGDTPGKSNVLMGVDIDGDVD